MIIQQFEANTGLLTKGSNQIKQQNWNTCQQLLTISHSQWKWAVIYISIHVGTKEQYVELVLRSEFLLILWVACCGFGFA